MTQENNRAVGSTFAAMRNLLEWTANSGESVSVAVNTDVGLAMGWYMNGYNSLTVHAFRLGAEVTLDQAVNLLMTALNNVASGQESQVAAKV